MAAVYILFSPSLKKYYVGSCKDVIVRIEQHLLTHFPKAFTSSAKDWCIYYSHNDLSYMQARRIESHIKKMKSRKFIENFKKYPEIFEQLKIRYQ